MQSNLHRSSYWPKLTELLVSQGLGKYEKNRTDMYHVLFPYMETAIINAEKLDKINKRKLPSDCAPGTQIHTLINKFETVILQINDKSKMLNWCHYLKKF